MMSFDLARTFDDTVAHMSHTWDQLGVPDIERERALQQLCAELGAVCSSALAAQRQRVADAQVRIDLQLTSIRSIANDLAESLHETVLCANFFCQTATIQRLARRRLRLTIRRYCIVLIS